MATDVGTATFKAVADFSSIRKESASSAAALRDVDKAAGQVGSGVTSGMGQGERAVMSFSDRVQSMSKTAVSTGKSMTLGLTSPLVALGAIGVKTFADFDTAIRRTAANVDATGPEFDALRDKALEMGAKTSFSATEAANALFELTAAGMSGAQAMEAIDGVMLLASATGMDLAEAAGLVAQSINAFRLDAKDAAHVADVFTEAMNQSALKAGDMTAAMAQAGELGSTAGQELTSVVAVLEALANQGVPAAQAGTAIRQAFASLKDPTSEASGLIERLGIVTRDAAGNMLQAPQIVQNLGAALDDSNAAFLEARTEAGMTAQAYKDYVLSTMFGVEGSKAMGLSLNAVKEFAVNDKAAMDDLARVTAVMGQAWVDAHKQGDKFVFTGGDAIQVMKTLGDTSDGTAKKFDDAMKKSVGRRIEALKGSLETLVIRIVDAVLPALMSLVKWTEKWVNKLSDFAKAHPEITKVVVALAGLLAAAGPILIVIGKIVGALTSIGALFAEGGLLAGIGATLGLVLLVVAAVVALVLAFIWAYNNVEWFRDAVDSVVQAVIGFVQDLIAEVESWKSTWEAIWHGVMDVVNEVVSFLRSQWEKIAAWWEKNQEKIGEAATEVWNRIKQVVMAVVNTVVAIVRAGVAVIRWVWENFGDEIMSVVRAVWEFVKSTISNAIDVVLAIIDFFVAVIRGDWGDAWQAILDVLSAVWAQIEAVITYAWEAVQAVLSAGLDALKIVWDTVWGAMAAGIGFVWGVITSIIRTAWDLIVLLWNNIGQPIVNTMRDGWSGILFIVGILKAVWDGFFDALKTAWDTVGQPIADKIIGAWNTIAGLVGAVVDAWHIVFGDDIPARQPNGDPWDNGGAPEGAEGAIVTRPTLALIGEAGPEAVVPLHKMPGASPVPDWSKTSPGVAASAAGGAPTVVTNVYPTPGMSEEEVGAMSARETMRGVRQLAGRVG